MWYNSCIIKIRTAQFSDAGALSVRKTQGRQGIAKQLLATAEKWGKESEAIYMRINSGESRKVAHEFYRKQGCDSEKLQVRFLKELK